MRTTKQQVLVGLCGPLCVSGMLMGVNASAAAAGGVVINVYAAPSSGVSQPHTQPGEEVNTKNFLASDPGNVSGLPSLYASGGNINIEAVVDADTIYNKVKPAKTPGTCDWQSASPMTSSLSRETIFMVTSYGTAIGGSFATDYLNVKVEAGNNLYWWMSSLTGNEQVERVVSYRAAITDFHILSSSSKNIIQKVPTPSDRWQYVVLKNNGTVTYSLAFKLDQAFKTSSTDDVEWDYVGCYKGDPKLTINP